MISLVCAFDGSGIRAQTRDKIRSGGPHHLLTLLRGPRNTLDDGTLEIDGNEREPDGNEGVAVSQGPSTPIRNRSLV